ncbi:hypothetical protein [Brucella anthropi]|uniref:hypothetical protein n=1 Tax=Brucella anthropi TaxID=529 RepID=UPI00216506BC|nr:hypothetical protein [Brucella anthropi]UVV66554.1 hypothetical protein NW321_08660 [Brucella anthropi]
MKPAGTTTNTMPERIYAKVHGASTDVISGQRGLIGGWNEHRRDGQTEFVRSDLALPHLQQGEPSAARKLALEEAHADDVAVDRFAVAMKEKLAKKRAEGRGGWENKDECSAEYLSYLLIQHIWKGDPVDIANLAMMLQQRGERVVIDSETSSIIPDHADAGKVEGDGRADLERFWRPISEADKSITFEQTYDIGDGKSMTIRNSDHYWVRDADGRVYEATWSDHKDGYWWDLEGESPVDPVEYMPHPLSLPSAPSHEVAGS